MSIDQHPSPHLVPRPEQRIPIARSRSLDSDRWIPIVGFRSLDSDRWIPIVGFRSFDSDPSISDRAIPICSSIDLPSIRIPDPISRSPNSDPPIRISSPIPISIRRIPIPSRSRSHDRGRSIPISRPI
jgi:hypothetical protein